MHLRLQACPTEARITKLEGKMATIGELVDKVLGVDKCQIVMLHCHDELSLSCSCCCLTLQSVHVELLASECTALHCTDVW